MRLCKKIIVCLVLFTNLFILNLYASNKNLDDVSLFLSTMANILDKKSTDTTIIFLKKFLWWNISYSWNEVDKKTNLSWSNVSPEDPSLELLTKIFQGTNLKAPIKFIAAMPTTEDYKKSCEINKKWKNTWLVWNGNYQLDEFKKLGFTGIEHTILDKDGNVIDKRKQQIDAKITLLYFNSEGQDIIIGLVNDSGRLKISYAGFRQECDA